MPSSENLKPAVVTVGNELTFGERRNGNQEWLCQQLFKRGAPADVVLSLPDDIEIIAHWIKHLKTTGHYPIIVSGGIGGTHDDLTRQSIAAGLGVDISRHPQCFAILDAKYKKDGREFTAQRQRMSELPDGCDLVANPIGAPGFHIQGVYGFPGFPSMVQPMFETIAPDVFGDVVPQEWDSIECTLPVAEGDVAMDVEQFANANPEGHMGIYPSTEKFGKEVTLRLRYPPNRADLAEAFTQTTDAIAQRLGVKPL